VSEEKNKPAPDELTLAKLLEAAYVLQEHNRDTQRPDLRPGLQQSSMKPKNHYSPQNSSSQANPPPPVPPTSNTSILRKIVETQHQIQVHRMEFVSALKLVAEQVSEMTHASGAAIGIVEGTTIRYRAVAGRSSPVPECFLPLNRSMAAPCLTTGEVFLSAQCCADSMMDREECRRRGIESLIAVPVFHNGAIAGGLEIYYDSPDAFRDEDIHTCQLMAGLVTEALGREEEATWKKSVADERAAMLEALEKLQPNLAALIERPDANSASPAQRPLLAAAPFSCRKCGHQLVPEEQFCGQCGSSRAADYEPRNLQSKVASLWQMRQSQQKEQKEFDAEYFNPTLGETVEKADDSGPASFLPPSIDQQIPEFFHSGELELVGNTEDTLPMTAPVEELGWVEQGEPAEEQDSVFSQWQEDPQPPQKAQTRRPAGSNSARSLRVFLGQLASSQPTGALLRFWNAHRGDIYLGFAVILVACVLRWGIWGDHSVKAPTAPARAAATQAKPAPDAGLSLLDRLLVQLGLAEAPDPPPDRGNPAAQVWVDLQTALYYCPGTDQYGKTAKGKFTTQREAQLDQFEPAFRKACN
jgi:GAF domain-containing protein